MTITTSPMAATMPPTDLATALAGLQQAVQALSDVVAQLQALAGTGAAAGAATLAGGPGQQSPTQGCGCGGGTGAAAGADQVGQAPPPKGDPGAPTGAKGAPTAASGGGDAAREAMRTDAPAPAGSDLGSKLVAAAKEQLGKPYVYAAAGPKAFDCSGLMLYVAKQFGIDLPHRASEQATKGTAVDRNDLQPGDMVFFQDGPEISHVGMYVGDGKYVHAPKTGDVVKISSLDDSWAKSHYKTARRLG